MKMTIFAVLGLVASVLAASFVLAPTAAASPTPHYTFTLFGDTLQGWGNTSSAISSAGKLFVSPGATVTIVAYGKDGVQHNWYLDLNNNQMVDWASDPHTANFTTTATVTFTAPTSGSFTYYCMFHPSAMKGTLVVSAPTFVLYGSAASPGNGWGLTSAGITQPGPTLNVTQGQTVSVDLLSADNAAHTFYVDFANTGSTSGNTQSATFNGTSVIRFTFAASAAGNFTYACGIHGASVMKGTLHVASTGGGGTPAAAPDYALYAGAVVIIAVVAIAAAVLLRRRPKAPPTQPPQ